MSTTTVRRDPRLSPEERGFGGAMRRFRQRARSGQLGSLPVLLGLVLIWVVFYIAEPRFLDPRNLTNLMLQIAGVGTIAVGIVLVLLLGEIDLSVGAVSGFAAGVTAVLNVKQGVPGVVAILAGLAVGAIIGLINGLFVTRLGVPSFVVTLAGFLGYTGALIFVLGQTGTVNLRDPGITGLATTFFADPVGWVIGLAAVGVFAAAAFRRRTRRRASGLSAVSTGQLVTQIVVVAVATLGTVAVMNADRGLPLAVLIFLGFVVLFDLITTRSRFGRYIYAVGGNAEAARRAGIGIQTVRLAVFTLGSTMAAAGGILLAARLLAVNQSSGSGTLLLNAIAAAVIGGTSLFGGRGRVWSALLGALVIGSISNGMDLLALSSSIKFMITGAVLLIAVTVDSAARRGERTGGR